MYMINEYCKEKRVGEVEINDLDASSYSCIPWHWWVWEQGDDDNVVDLKRMVVDHHKLWRQLSHLRMVVDLFFFLDNLGVQTSPD